jgi:CRP/FNR family transcriptional regulator
MASPSDPFQPQVLAARLSKIEHFKDLSLDEVVEIVRSGQIHHYQRGEVIFIENDPGKGLYVLLSGQVQLCKLSPEGQIAILAVFDPMIMFNEVAALDRGPTPATALAIEDSVIWQIEPGYLETAILKHPRIGLGMLKMMAKHNRHLVGHFEDLSFRSILARTAKLLLELSRSGTAPIERRKYPNSQLAARIATIPEAFSRSLKVFRVNGDILTTYKIIEVLRPDRLLRAAQLGPWEEEMPFQPNGTDAAPRE